jgi:hypothetical protein
MQLSVENLWSMNTLLLKHLVQDPSFNKIEINLQCTSPGVDITPANYSKQAAG